MSAAQSAGTPTLRSGRFAMTSGKSRAESCFGSVTGGGGEALTRRRVSRAELDADSDEQVARVLAILVERRLLVADDGSVELVHEALLEQWPRLGRGSRRTRRAAGSTSI